MGGKAIEFSPRHQTLVIPSVAQWVLSDIVFSPSANTCYAK
jgi:hypothetical protein